MGVSPINRCVATALAFRGSVGNSLHRHQDTLLPEAQQGTLLQYPLISDNLNFF